MHFTNSVILQSITSSFRHSWPSFKLAWHSSRLLCCVVGLLTVGASGFPLAVAYVGKLIIDAIVAGNLHSTVIWIGIEGLVVAMQSGVARLLFLSQTVLGAKLGADVNILILEKAVQLELQHFEDSEIYDQLTRARQQASVRPVAMVTDMLQLIQHALTFVGYLGLLLSFSPYIVLGLIIASVPATISEMKFSNTAFRMRTRRSPESRKLNYLEYVLATDDHVKEVKVLGLSQLFLNRYRELAYQFFREDKTLAISRSIWAYGLSLGATVMFYGCYLTLGFSAASGAITLGYLMLYIVAFRQGQQAFQSGLTAVGNMYESNLYMSNLFEFLSIPTHAPRHRPFLTPDLPTEYGIRFDNVGFQYAGKPTWALRHISLFIPKGQRLALVGHNGAGKSTFIKLILRLYAPTEGRILLDGIDLQDWPIDQLHHRMAVVFQDFNEYQLSVKENVGVGKVDFLDDTPAITQAIDMGGMTDVITELHDGVDTQLGRWFSKGMELSGGQWQKVALSRGFMRQDADILILDEPTAALDAVAEKAVFDRFAALTKGKTSLLISHRFPTVRTADFIVVIEKGHVIEEGTHDNLINKNGTYATLFKLQAAGYL